MGDFNIAQFIGGIVEGMGKGLTSDKGGSQGMNMEVIPKRKNAPPIIEMTPSQQAGQHIQEGAIGAIRGMATSDDLDRGGGAGVLSPATPMQRDGSGVVMRAPVEEAAFVADVDDMSPMPRWRAPRHPMRQMRSGGITEPGEEVIVHENEKVQGLPNGQVIVTPEEEVAVDRQGAPSETVLRGAGAHTSPDLPPNMSLPDTVQQGPNDEGYLQNELLKNMDVKPSPWKDLGAALIQAGNNYFNNKNEPVRTWGEIQRDKKVAPLAAKLALVRDTKDRGLKTRLTNAQIAKAEGEPERLQAETDRKNRLADVKEFDSIVNAEYKANVISLGRDRADEVKANNQKMFELRQRGVDQNDERIQILKERNAELKRHALVTEGQTDKRITLDQQKADQLNKHRASALKIAAARKGSDGSPQSKTKIAQAEAALRKSVAKAVKDGVMDEDEAQDILAEGIPGYLKGGVFPIDE